MTSLFCDSSASDIRLSLLVVFDVLRESVQLAFPKLTVPGYPFLRSLQGAREQVASPCPTFSMLAQQARSLEDTQMLGDCRWRDAKRLGQLRDRGISSSQPSHDRPARWVREREKRFVELSRLCINHAVKYREFDRPVKLSNSLAATTSPPAATVRTETSPAEKIAAQRMSAAVSRWRVSRGPISRRYPWRRMLERSRVLARMARYLSRDGFCGILRLFAILESARPIV